MLISDGYYYKWPYRIKYNWKTITEYRKRTLCSGYKGTKSSLITKKRVREHIILNYHFTPASLHMPHLRFVYEIDDG